MPGGFHVQVAGMVSCRQWSGTAKGHCFISLDDETGIANLFVPQKSFEAFMLVIITQPFLLVHGRVQISEGDQPTVYVNTLPPPRPRLSGPRALSPLGHLLRRPRAGWPARWVDRSD